MVIIQIVTEHNRAGMNPSFELTEIVKFNV